MTLCRVKKPTVSLGVQFTSDDNHASASTAIENPDEEEEPLIDP